MHRPSIRRPVVCPQVLGEISCESRILRYVLIPPPRGAVKTLLAGLLVAPSSDLPETHRIPFVSTSDRATRQLEGSCVRQRGINSFILLLPYYIDGSSSVHFPGGVKDKRNKPVFHREASRTVEGTRTDTDVLLAFAESRLEQYGEHT
jgi:hypothetical protein